MAKIKILGKTKLSGKVIFNAPLNLQPQFLNIWSYEEPSVPVNISNFSISYDSGTLLLDWESGSQQLNSNEAVNFNL
jgi:hypothetical protein